MTSLDSTAAHGSVFVGSHNIATITSAHLMARVELNKDVRIHLRNLAAERELGNVHVVPCNILGIINVATPLALRAWWVGHTVARMAEAML